jgi:hypothetical protein
VAEPETPWAFKPVLGPLTPTDIMAIAGASLGPLTVGAPGHYKYRPFLPLAAAGHVLGGKQELAEAQALERQGQAATSAAIAPLYYKATGQELPPNLPSTSVAPIMSAIKAATPKVDYTPAQQAEWEARLTALPEDRVSAQQKEVLKAAGPKEGAHALSVWFPDAFPRAPDVHAQRMAERLEPIQFTIGGKKEVAGLQHGYKGEEIAQKAAEEAEQAAISAQFKREQAERDLAAAGPRERVKAEGKIVAEDEKTMGLVDQGIVSAQRLRDLAAQITTGRVSGSEWVIRAKEVFQNDPDYALFKQLLKQAALPNIKPLLGGNAISDADREAVLEMMASPTAPTEANLKSLDAVLLGLNATKNLVAARTQYFDEHNTFKGFGKEEQVPNGPRVRYTGDREGLPIYEDFARGIRFTKDPESGKWVGWTGS